MIKLITLILILLVGSLYFVTQKTIKDILNIWFSIKNNTSFHEHMVINNESDKLEASNSKNLPFE